jgi:transcriptional antiterminator RfaH
MARLWYVATTKSNHEHIAERELRKQGYFPFNPRVRVRETYNTKHGEKSRLVIRAYFPNYIFVRFDAQKDRWWPILSTKGVTSLIIQDEFPVPVRPGVISTLMASMGDGFLQDERVDEVIRELHIGDEVKIKEGAFSGLKGTVSKMSSHEKISIILSVFGRENVVDLAREAVA